MNAQRLKEYRSKLVLFPRNQKKPKAADSPADALKGVQQVSGVIMPLKKKTHKAVFRAITEEEKNASAVWHLRRARADARLVGYRKKKAAEKAEAADK